MEFAYLGSVMDLGIGEWAACRLMLWGVNATLVNMTVFNVTMILVVSAKHYHFLLHKYGPIWMFIPLGFLCVIYSAVRFPKLAKATILRLDIKGADNLTNQEFADYVHAHIRLGWTDKLIGWPGGNESQSDQHTW